MVESSRLYSTGVELLVESGSLNEGEKDVKKGEYLERLSTVSNHMVRPLKAVSVPATRNNEPQFNQSNDPLRRRRGAL